jgi:AcrR family transcriptional regulator
MSPRPYQLGKRQAQVDEARRRVLGAARELLARSDSYAAFTVEAVAKRADVARATVYYQFGSKTGLLEAVCDDLAEAGGMDHLSAVFQEAQPVAALEAFIEAFARFWAADRPALRKLRALAGLDPEVAAVIAERDGRRMQGLQVLSLGLTPADPPAARELARVLHMLTSFETFDALDPDEDGFAGAVPVVVTLAGAAVANARARRG